MKSSDVRPRRLREGELDCARTASLSKILTHYNQSFVDPHTSLVMNQQNGALEDMSVTESATRTSLTKEAVLQGTMLG